ncbi:MAG: PAS domain-containing protein [Bacteroidales bacterium]|nr:PAS domain-containing protein [Bacteroidales bacterium]
MLKNEILNAIKELTWHNPFSIIIADENEYILYCNEAFVKFLGYSYNDIVNKNLRQFTNREEFSTFQVNTKLRKRGFSNVYKSTFIDKNGKHKDVIISASPAYLNNEFVGILAVIIDYNEYFTNFSKLQNLYM